MSAATQPAVVQYDIQKDCVELRELPIPEFGDDDVLLRVGAASVCGSDIHQWHATHSWPVNTPVTLGHEFGGTIEKVGRNVKGFKEGDRVVSETAAYICGRCIMCRSGRYNLCPTRKGFGYGLHGAMTRYVRVPERCLHNIPDTLPFHYACLTEPCSVAYSAMIANARIRPGDMVVVIGPGPIGLLCARMAALCGANPLIVAGRTADAERLDAALKLGATRIVNVDEENLEEVVASYDPMGAELVCEASGASKPVEIAIRMARPDGQVVKVGWSPQNVPIDLNPLVQKNVTLQGSFSHNYPMWEKVIRLLDTGQMMPELIVGVRSGLEGWRHAFEAMHEGKVIKSVLEP